MAIPHDEIFQKVKDVLVDALGVEENEITPNARLIVFRLEKTFSIRISREELFPAEGLLNSGELVTNGKLTDKGLEVLRKQLPHVDMTEFAKNPTLSKLADLFTVEAVVKFLEHKVNTA
jgi:acyl carrier protein